MKLNNNIWSWWERSHTRSREADKVTGTVAPAPEEKQEQNGGMKKRYKIEYENPKTFNGLDSDPEVIEAESLNAALDVAFEQFFDDFSSDREGNTGYVTAVEVQWNEDEEEDEEVEGGESRRSYIVANTVYSRT